MNNNQEFLILICQESLGCYAIQIERTRELMQSDPHQAPPTQREKTYKYKKKKKKKKKKKTATKSDGKQRWQNCLFPSFPNRNIWFFSHLGLQSSNILQCLIWVYTVCKGLSVPIYNTYKHSANSADPDQTLQNVACDQGRHCLADILQYFRCIKRPISNFRTSMVRR